jgi:predicted alpha/beta hydrolase
VGAARHHRRAARAAGSHADLPLTWIGHSLGAQIAPFVPDHRELARVITIAAGSGYWRDNVRALRPRMWLLWYVLTPLLGYFPGKRLRLIGDLPAGGVRQWRRWCLDPHYAVGAEGPAVRELYARVTAPITSLSFTDDEMMSERNTESLHGFSVVAPTTLRRIAPETVGMQPRHDFAGVLARARDTGEYRSRLAQEIGVKGYHPDGIYPFLPGMPGS